jgi:hypothetical protein
MSGSPANASLDQVLASLQKMGVSSGGAAPAPVMPESASQAQMGGRRRRGRKNRKTNRKNRKTNRKNRKNRKTNRRNRNRRN